MSSFLVIGKHALMACLFLVAFLSLTSVMSGDDKAKKDKDPLAPLQGGWKVTGLEKDGKPAELPGVDFWWVVKGNKLYYGGQELAKLTADGATNPTSIDLAFHKPERVNEAIFSVDGDTLKLCLNRLADGVKERPNVFSTEGKSDWRLLTFQRDKDRKIDDLEGLGGFVGLQIKSEKEKNELVIAAILDDSPAKKSDLKKDDVILKVAGQDATDLLSTVKSIRGAKPGSDLVIRVKRGDKEKDVTVKVGVAPMLYLLD
jgi:uncharacterized protein (TIGR03067 family)